MLFRSLVLVLCLGLSLASGAEVLTLNDALTIADKNNPQARAALAQVEVARAERTIAKAIPNPSLVTDNGIRSERTYRFIGLEGTFELGGKRRGRMKVAEGLTNQALIEAQTTLRDVRVQVHKAYAELAVSQERLKLVQARYEIAQKIYGQIDTRSEVGDSSGLDLIRAKSSFDLSKIDLERTKVDLNKARIRLNALLNFPEDKLVETENIQALKPTYNKMHDHPELEEIKVSALSERLEVALVRARRETEEARLSLARRQFIPDLTLAVGPSLDVGNPLGLFVTGRMNLPIFGTTRGDIVKAQAQLNQLSLEEASLRNKIEAEINQAYQELELTESTYFTYKDNLLSQADELEKMVGFGVQKGAFRMTELFALQNETRQLREKYLQTLLDYQFALAELERAVGRSLVGFGRNI